MSVKAVLQKGNALVIVLLLIITLGAGGYYLYSARLGPFSIDSPSPVAEVSIFPTSSSLPTPSPDNSNSLLVSPKVALTITSPLNGALLKSGNVTLKGKTVPNAEVFVNDQATKADAQGNFTLNLTIDEGSNTLVVTANDESGNVTEQTLFVNVQTF